MDVGWDGRPPVPQVSATGTIIAIYYTPADPADPGTRPLSIYAPAAPKIFISEETLVFLLRMHQTCLWQSEIFQGLNPRTPFIWLSDDEIKVYILQRVEKIK